MTDSVPFGKYTLLERLASGAVADIYRATTRTATGEDLPVVIKKIHDELAADADFLAGFVDEARVASMLEHPNIVKVFEWGRNGNNLFIAMEYIEGTNLATLMQAVVEQAVRFPPTIGIYIVSQALAGLAYAHQIKDAFGNSLGLVHRNMSPPNIVISSAGQVKLVDFGLARVSSRLIDTRPDVFRGEYGYLAPEVLGRRELDGRADLFSLGVTLYEVLSGKKIRAQAAETQIEAISRTIRQTPPSLIHADIPVELDKLLVSAMSESPSERPASAVVMRTELDAFLDRWDRKIDADALSSFLVDALSGRMGQKKENVSFAFGEATSQWMARGENLEELVKISPAGVPRPDDLFSAAPLSQPPPSDASQVTEPVFAPPVGKFSKGETVMAIKEGGLGKGRQFKNLVIVLLGVALLVGVAVLVVWQLIGKEGRVKKRVVKSSPAEVEKFAGALTVTTQPDGAVVLVDGDLVERQGDPPRIMGLRAGDHSLKLVVAGYEPWQGDITLLADKPYLVEKKLKQRRGKLVIDSQPGKAWVYLDGKRIGRTPRTITNLPLGKAHKIVLFKKHYSKQHWEIGPADWPEHPANELTVTKKLTRPVRRRRRR
ncbi:MAG TPA: protein kinase [Myxococcota bacterium]|nr:protein kinase [Myxococcota bacterium]